MRCWRGGAAAALLVAGAMSVPSTASGQELEPRAYANLPIGLNFLLGGYAYTQGGLATDPALPLRDANLRTHTAVTAYARSLGVLGMSAKVDAILPYSWLSGDATFAGQPREREVSGFNDPRFRFTLNFYGAPALTMEEFASYEQDIIVGASLQVSVPLGQYDSSKLINLGTNRWFIKPELGISKAWGPLTLEIAPSVTFYTKNDDFLNGMTREQDPLYSLQGHLVYSFGRGIWGALDSTYYVGGSTEVNGVENDDRQEKLAFGRDFIRADRSAPLDQALWQHRRLDSDRQRLRRRWCASAVPLGPGVVAGAPPRTQRSSERYGKLHIATGRQCIGSSTRPAILRLSSRMKSR